MLLLVALAAALGAVPARAQLPPGPDDLRAATETVTRQLAAFNRDDFDTAYTFASASIRAQFTRAAFERMVTASYPEIARSASAHVAEATLGPGGHLYLLVRIRGANGRAIEALYDLVQEDGAWRIDAVVSRPDTSERT
jgi:hypothetical protein